MLHIFLMKYFCNDLKILLGIVVSALAFHAFNSPARQIFKSTFSPFSPSPPVAITKRCSLDYQPLKSLKFSPLNLVLTLPGTGQGIFTPMS